MTQPLVLDFYNQLLNMLDQQRLLLRMDALWLGGSAGPDGGSGGRPGGYIGYLPQSRVAYDQTEAATIVGSSSLVDNLNHIRYNIATLSGSVASGGGGGLTNYSAYIGDGSGISFIVEHNLGTRDVLVQVYAYSGSYDTIVCEVDRTTINTVTLGFSEAPAVSGYRVVIGG